MKLLELYKESEEVGINSHQGLHIINYRHLGVDWSNELNRLARGLILDDESNIIARPFEKFFNMNELVGRESIADEVIKLSEPDDGPIEVTDKLDGSLVTAYYHNGLQFASSGSLNGPHTQKFREAAEKLWSKDTFARLEELTKTHTVIFEYTSPSNVIVIEYETEDLRLIGIRRTSDGKEYTMAEAKELTKGFGIEYAEVLDFDNMDDVLKYIDSTRNIEGVVVMFTNTGKRVKIKTEDYFLKHREGNDFVLYGKLNKSNIDYIETHMFADNKGLLDDLLARYRAREDMVGIINEADTLMGNITKMLLDIDKLGLHTEEAFASIEGINLYETIKNPETVFVDGYEFSTTLIAAIRDKIEHFHKRQEEYFAINKLVRSTYYKKLMKVIDDEVGIVSNYQGLISNKSYIYNVLEPRAIWDIIKPH